MALYVSSCRRSLATLISGGRGAAEHTDRLLHAAITSLIQAVRIPPRERCLKAFLRLINYSAGDLYSLIHLNSSSVTFSSRDFPASVLPDSIISHSALFIFLSEKRTQFVGELPGFLTMAVSLNLYWKFLHLHLSPHPLNARRRNVLSTALVTYQQLPSCSYASGWLLSPTQQRDNSWYCPAVIWSGVVLMNSLNTKLCVIVNTKCVFD